YPSTGPDSAPEDADGRAVELPQHDLDVPSRDLLLRLLRVQPSARLRSLRALQTIAFYKGFDFEEVRQKRVKPNDLLPPQPPEGSEEFPDFDESFDTVL
ncbi:hypothetical protein BDFB_007922, partial [Asbolus verrucosus]